MKGTAVAGRMAEHGCGAVLIGWAGNLPSGTHQSLISRTPGKAVLGEVSQEWHFTTSHPREQAVPGEAVGHWVPLTTVHHRSWCPKESASNPLPVA